MFVIHEVGQRCVLDDAYAASHKDKVNPITDDSLVNIKPTVGL